MAFQILCARRPAILVSIFSIILLSLIILFQTIDYAAPRKWSNIETFTNSTYYSKSSSDYIPRNIWQIYFGDIPACGLDQAMLTCVSKNPSHSHILMRDEGADALIRNHYSNRLDLLNTFLDLNVPVLRSDLLRYMLLESEGGIYSDLDTTAERPIEEWIPEEFRSKTHAIVGIEYDQLDAENLWPGLSLKVQFCQWTLASSRGHPLMARIVEKVAHSIQNLAKEKGTPVQKLEVTDHEVTQTTGPVIWTKTVFEGLSAAVGREVTYRDITNITEPHLFGDILVLPIDGFGTGQEHSNSNKYGAEDALVRHQFKGSWKHNWP